MPLVPTSSDTEPALYYRHWPAEESRATVVLLHGIGESSNLYHRFYVDQLVNDPFGLPEPDLTVFFREDLPALWDRLTAGADLIVYPGIRHDLLNDVGHAQVAGDIVEFVLGIQK